MISNSVNLGNFTTKKSHKIRIIIQGYMVQNRNCFILQCSYLRRQIKFESPCFTKSAKSFFDLRLLQCNSLKGKESREISLRYPSPTHLHLRYEVKILRETSGLCLSRKDLYFLQGPTGWFLPEDKILMNGVKS